MFGLAKQKGFTLIELLIAITIIGILSATLVPRVVNILPTARDGARKASLNDVIAAVEAYNLDEGSYPSVAFCLTGDPVDLDGAGDGTDTSADFVSDYLRNSPPEFQDVEDETTCPDSVYYSPGVDDAEYAVSTAVELAKSGNSTANNQVTEPEGEVEASYFVIER